MKRSREQVAELSQETTRVCLEFFLRLIQPAIDNVQGENQAIASRTWLWKQDSVRWTSEGGDKIIQILSNFHNGKFALDWRLNTVAHVVDKVIATYYTKTNHPHPSNEIPMHTLLQHSTPIVPHPVRKTPLCKKSTSEHTWEHRW